MFSKETLIPVITVIAAYELASAAFKFAFKKVGKGRKSKKSK